MTDISRTMAESSDPAESGGSFYRDDEPDLTLEDLGQLYVEERAVTVRDVMTPIIHQVPVTASIAEVAQLMLNRRIHRVVVTQGEDPVGVITSMDLLRVLGNKRR